MTDLYAEMLHQIVARDHAPRAVHFGQGPGDLPGFSHVVTTEEVADLNADIVHLNTDVIGMTIPDPIEPATEAEHAAAFGKRIELLHVQRAYTNFKSEWDVWRREHSSWFSRVGDEPHRAFDQFRTEYNEWLRRFKESFGSDKTKAKERKRERKADPLGAVQTTVNLVSIAVIGAAVVYAYSQVAKK